MVRCRWTRERFDERSSVYPYYSRMTCQRQAWCRLVWVVCNLNGTATVSISKYPSLRSDRFRSMWRMRERGTSMNGRAPLIATPFVPLSRAYLRRVVRQTPTGRQAIGSRRPDVAGSDTVAARRSIDTGRHRVVAPYSSLGMDIRRERRPLAPVI